MSTESLPPRWGRVDDDTAARSLAITLPLAVIFSVLVLFTGWLYAPKDRKILSFVEKLDDHPDVQAVYTTLDDDSILESV